MWWLHRRPRLAVTIWALKGHRKGNTHLTGRPHGRSSLGDSVPGEGHCQSLCFPWSDAGNHHQLSEQHKCPLAALYWHGDRGWGCEMSQAQHQGWGWRGSVPHSHAGKGGGSRYVFQVSLQSRCCPWLGYRLQCLEGGEMQGALSWPFGAGQAQMLAYGSTADSKTLWRAIAGFLLKLPILHTVFASDWSCGAFQGGWGVSCLYPHALGSSLFASSPLFVSWASQFLCSQ